MIPDDEMVFVLAVLLSALFPVFAMMLSGGIAARYSLLPSGGDTALNRYVYYFAVPALLITGLGEASVNQILRWDFMIGYLLAAMGVYIGVFVFAHCLLKRSIAESGIQSYTASFANTGYIGIPLLLGLFPDSPDAIIAAVITTVLSNVMLALALAKIELHYATQGYRIHQLAGRIVFRVLMNPFILATVVGFLISWMQLLIPVPISRFLHMLADTTCPVALFAIGMVLAGRSAEQPVPVPGGSREVASLLVVSGAKLILQPLLTLVCLRYLGVSGQWLRMGTLLAALPTAANVYVIAEQYGIYTKGAARAIMVGTLVTLLTVPLVQILLTRMA
ncbi:MAG: hypothetical protein B0D91_15355 [Oceanospirillales bacterium LUC14_002_19_P2]|nr:MAG: hypothetical protein B0D91_15355 [Oceanospirillales bacterium LUC14_002_19_P2]